MDLKDALISHGIDAVDRGKNIRAGNIGVPCPFCGDDPSQHMTISLVDPVGIWGCWRNQRHTGSAYSLHKLLIALGVPSGEARAIRDDLVGDSQPAAKRPASREAVEPIHFPTHELDNLAWRYLKKRWKYMREEDIPEMADRYGLCLSKVLRGRIIVPVEENGQMVNYVARAIDSGAKLRYITAPQGEGRSLRDCVYNEGGQIGKSHLVVCEGVFDAISIEYLHSEVHAVAVFGVGVGASQIDVLRRMMPNYKKVSVCFDRNAEGQALDLAWGIGAEWVECPADDPEGVRIFE